MNRWKPRREADRWPGATPVWLIGTQLVALIVAMVIQYYCYDRIWTPLQRFYFSAYIRSQILIRFGTGGSGGRAHPIARCPAAFHGHSDVPASEGEP